MPEGMIDTQLLKAVANRLMSAVFGNFEANTADYDSADQNMLRKLTENVWHFSAAKNYTQLRELTNALLGSDGKLRSFSDFMAAAFTINDRHIKQHLKAEYELAVAGSQMASKWVDIQAQKFVLPLLEFDAVIDSQTTDLCRSLHGTLLPADHSFWKTYYPPNHFGCRSTVRQRATGKITEAGKIPGADIPDMFKVNLSASGLIFPKDHPYFEGVPDEVFHEARKLMPYDLQFDESLKSGKGILREHFEVSKSGKDYNTVFEIGSDFMKKGKRIDIMPILTKDNDQRAAIFPDGKPGRSADLRINGVLHEVKAPFPGFRFNTLKHSISDAAAQADHVIVKLCDRVDNNILKRLSKGRFIDHKDLQEVIYKLSDGEYISHKRAEFLK